MDQKLKILEILAKLAMANDEFKSARLACAIMKRNKIISFGVNKNKTHPLMVKYGKNESAIYLHAEISAIKNALAEISIDDLRGSDLYVCRVKRPEPHSDKWEWGLALPCSGCARAIVDFGIKNVIYSTNTTGKYEVI